MIDELLPAFYMRVAYPLYDRLRGRQLMRRYAELMRNERRSPEEIVELQRQSLETLVKHASVTSPYYRKRFEAVGMTGRYSHDRFSALPVLRKKDIQDHMDEIVSTAVRRSQLLAGRTGGSTGEPTRFFHDRTALDYIRASNLRNAGWAGYRVGMKVLKVTGSHFDYSRSKRWQVRLANAIVRQQFMTATDLRPETMNSVIKRMRKWKPAFFWGYASALYTIAEHLLRTEEKLPLRAVISSSDNLTPQMRSTISEAFECPVFDAYSSRELTVGWECELHRGFHINSDVSYVEIVDNHDHPTPPGESGRILVTDLHNFGFPFIRYDIGDRGTLASAPCDCGLPFPLLASLDGRSDDFIIRPDGSRISPPAFTVLMSDFPTLRDYQIRQQSDGHVVVSLVLGGAWTSADELHLQHGLATILGSELPYRSVFCSRIDWGPSGKRRPVLSQLGKVA